MRGGHHYREVIRREARTRRRRALQRRGNVAARGQHVVRHGFGEILPGLPDQPAGKLPPQLAPRADRGLRTAQAPFQGEHLVAPVHHPDARLAALQAAQDRGDVGLRRACRELGLARQRLRLGQAPLALRKALEFKLRLTPQRVVARRRRNEQLWPVVQGSGHRARGRYQRALLSFEQYALQLVHVHHAGPRQGEQGQRHQHQLRAQPEREAPPHSFQR